MNLTPAYHAIIKALDRDERLLHSSGGRGVFVFVRRDVGFHDIGITPYPISATRGPVVPRLNIDKSWTRRLPLIAARRWRLTTGTEERFTRLGLEITVLEDQLLLLAERVPAILRHVETGHRTGFESLLPFDTKSTTELNIWSVEARELADRCLRERGPAHPRSVRQILRYET